MSNPPAPLRPAVGVGVVIVKGSHVLLIKRGQAPRLGEWSIPGGHQELGETVRECGLREVMEETGLTVANLRLIDVVDAFGKNPDGSLRNHWTLVDFRAEWVSGEPVAGGDAADAQWVPVDSIADFNLWPETVRVITAAMAMP